LHHRGRRGSCPSTRHACQQNYASGRHLQGLDSLLSIVQMPRGVPVATFAIGEAGAVNAALFAVALLATADISLAGKLGEFRRSQEAKVHAMILPPAKP